MSQQTLVSEILAKQWRKKKRSRPNYSLRALARDLQMDPSFISRIFKGQKPLPTERVEDFVQMLDMDPLSTVELKRALLLDFAEKMGLGIDYLNTTDSGASLTLKFEDYSIPENQESLLDPWYKIAILDMVTLENFVFDPPRISRQLGITMDDFSRAWNFLVRGGFVLQNKELNWSKSESKIRIATKRSTRAIRQFHKSLMIRAIDEMAQHPDNESFAKRLITGATVAVNLQQIEKIKLQLNAALLEACQSATEGPTQEVYGINISFFPLTRIHSKQ